MHVFDTEETALALLIENKKPDCVEALKFEFQDARERLGLSIREAFRFSESIHFLKDHDGLNHAPELNFEPTDENARQAIVDALMKKNDDGKAEERVDILMKWYDLYLSWGNNVPLAFYGAHQAGQEEWETNNDLDEAEAIQTLHELPEESELDKDLKNRIIQEFYARRNKGNSVYVSLRGVLQDAQEALELAAFVGLLGSDERKKHWN